jgi:hypothetical protein
MVRFTIDFWKRPTAAAIDISTHVTPPWVLAKSLLLSSDPFVFEREANYSP